jgi:hypothetical protein
MSTYTILPKDDSNLDIAITGTDGSQVVVIDTATQTVTVTENVINVDVTPGLVGSLTVDSVNGQVGVIVLDTDDIQEDASPTNKYYTQARFESSLATADTDDLAQGTTNKYFADSLARGAISATGDIAYDSNTGIISFSGQAGLVTSVNGQGGTVYLDTDDIAEGTGDRLYFTTARFNQKIAVTRTDDIAEGTNNLYFTQVRTQNVITANTQNFLTSLNGATGPIATIDADDVPESATPTNKYYTDVRARLAVTAVDSGGDGSLVYNNSTGVFTYTGPNAAEVRAHFGVANTAGGDGSLTYDANTGIYTFNGPTPSESRAHFSATDTGGDGSFGYNQSTGVFTYTGPSPAEVRAHITAGEGIDFSGGVISGEDATYTNKGIAKYNIDEFYVDGGTVNIAANGIDSTHIDFGTGANQVSTTDLTEGSNLYYTDARVDAHLTGGTGVTYTTGTISIGQDVSTTSDVTFGEVTSTEFIGPVRGGNIFQASATEALSKGDAVYIDGVSGNKPTVAKADANDASKMPAFGLANADANANANVDVIVTGQLTNLDTSSFTLGANLYVSNTAGELTDTPPTGETSLLQNLGKVEKVHASTGTIFVTGAGRVNATPNLDSGKIFLGNGSNQSVTETLDTSIVPEDGNLYYTNTRVNTQLASGNVDDVIVGGNLTVNGTTTTIDTTNLLIEDNIFELNHNVTGTPVKDSGMIVNRGSQDNAAFIWDESADNFTLGTTTADGTEGTITVTKGTLNADITGDVTGAVTGNVTGNLTGDVTGNVSGTSGTTTSLSNHTTNDLSEGSTNLYYTDARVDAHLNTTVTATKLTADNDFTVIDGTSTTYGAPNYTVGPGTLTLKTDENNWWASQLTLESSEGAVINMGAEKDTTNDTYKWAVILDPLNNESDGGYAGDYAFYFNKNFANAASTGVVMHNRIFGAEDEFQMSIYGDNNSALNGVYDYKPFSVMAEDFKVYARNAHGSVTSDPAIKVSHASIKFHNNYEFPFDDGAADRVLTTDGSGNLDWEIPGAISVNSVAHDANGNVQIETDDIAEGTNNLYYTAARDTAQFLTDFASRSTTQLTEGGNLYYTNARADARISAASIDDLSDVDTSTVAPSDGQVLAWDNTASKWEPLSITADSDIVTINGTQTLYNKTLSAPTVTEMKVDRIKDGGNAGDSITIEGTGLNLDLRFVGAGDSGYNGKYMTKRFARNMTLPSTVPPTTWNYAEKYWNSELNQTEEGHQISSLKAMMTPFNYTGTAGQEGQDPADWTENGEFFTKFELISAASTKSTGTEAYKSNRIVSSETEGGNKGRLDIDGSEISFYNNEYKFPDNDGSNGQFLKTNGTGTLSFASPPVSGLSEGTGIDFSGSVTAPTINIDSTVATISGSQTFTNKSGDITQWTNNANYSTRTSTETLTNKTLTSPILNNPTLNDPLLTDLYVNGGRLDIHTTNSGTTRQFSLQAYEDHLSNNGINNVRWLTNGGNDFMRLEARGSSDAVGNIQSVLTLNGSNSSGENIIQSMQSSNSNESATLSALKIDASSLTVSSSLTTESGLTNNSGNYGQNIYANRENNGDAYGAVASLVVQRNLGTEVLDQYGLGNFDSRGPAIEFNLISDDNALTQYQGGIQFQSNNDDDTNPEAWFRAYSYDGQAQDNILSANKDYAYLYGRIMAQKSATLQNQNGDNEAPLVVKADYDNNPAVAAEFWNMTNNDDDSVKLQFGTDDAGTKTYNTQMRSYKDGDIKYQIFDVLNDDGTFNDRTAFFGKDTNTGDIKNKFFGQNRFEQTNTATNRDTPIYVNTDMENSVDGSGNRVNYMNGVKTNANFKSYGVPDNAEIFQAFSYQDDTMGSNPPHAGGYFGSRYDADNGGKLNTMRLVSQTHDYSIEKEIAINSFESYTEVPFKYASYSTTERNALDTPNNGSVIYNSTDSKLQVYIGGWKNLDEETISLTELKTVVAASSDFADFQTRIAAL